MTTITVAIPVYAETLTVEWQDGKYVITFKGYKNVPLGSMEVLDPEPAFFSADHFARSFSLRQGLGAAPAVDTSVTLPPWQCCKDPGCWRAGQCLDSVHCADNHWSS